MLHFFQNRSFRTKTFAICLAISLLPTIVLGLFCYRHLQTLLIEKEQTVLRNSIIQESLTISSQISNLETISEYIIWDSGLISVLNQTYDKNSQMAHVYSKEIQPYFSTLKHLSSNIEELTIYTDLNIYPRTGVLEPVSKLESLSSYSKISNSAGALWIYTPEDNCLSVVRRFIDISSDVSAFILIQVNKTQFFSRLTTLFDDSFGVMLVDADNNLLWEYHTDDIPDYGPDSSSDNYIVETTVDSHTGWTYYIFRPSQIILAPTKTILSSALTLVFVCLICVLLFSYWLSLALVQPLENLTKNINQVAQGNYEITITSHSSDEVGQLIKNFSSMVQQINQLINETLKSKIIQQKLEFRALQAQINPHFLYNTLSLINSQSIIAGHPEIGLLARYLSTFYRTSLSKENDLILIKYRFAESFLPKSEKNCKLLSPHTEKKELIKRRYSCTLPARFLAVS